MITIVRKEERRTRIWRFWETGWRAFDSVAGADDDSGDRNEGSER